MERALKYKQSGSIKVVLAVVAGVIVIAAAVGAKYYLDEFRSGFDEPPTFTHEELFRPVREINIEKSRKLDVVFKCSALAESAGYERDIQIIVGKYLLAYERGEMAELFEETDYGAAIPAKMDLKFEIWRGTILNGSVEVKGWYTEGASNTVKRVNLDGTFKNGVLDLHGKRGPRYCSVKTPDADS